MKAMSGDVVGASDLFGRPIGTSGGMFRGSLTEKDVAVPSQHQDNAGDAADALEGWKK